jgi:hypothetical protein
MDAFDVMRQDCIHGPFTKFRSANLPDPPTSRWACISREGAVFFAHTARRLEESDCLCAGNSLSTSAGREFDEDVLRVRFHGLRSDAQ